MIEPYKKHSDKKRATSNIRWIVLAGYFMFAIAVICVSLKIIIPNRFGKSNRKQNVQPIDDTFATNSSRLYGYSLPNLMSTENISNSSSSYPYYKFHGNNKTNNVKFIKEYRRHH